MTTNGVVAGERITGARDYQEDTFQIIQLQDTDPSGWLLVLADGMGGHVGGARASDLAVTTFIAHFESAADEDIGQRLRQSLDAANQAIDEDVTQNPDYTDMGCTLLACLITGDELHWISVGDSLLWQLQKNTMMRLNADHSMRPVLEGLVDLGRMTAEEMEADPRINQLCSAVIGGDLPKVDQNYTFLTPDDRVILASDGLETLTVNEIGQICERVNPEKAVNALMTEIESRQRPKQDNTTAVIYKHVEEAR